MGWRTWLGLSQTMDDFAQELIREAGRRGSSGWTYDAAERVLHQGDNGSRMNLDNAYLEHSRAKRSERKDLLGKYVGLLVDSEKRVPELWELAARSIYPVVRSRFGTLSLEIQTRPETLPPIVRWPWIEDLCIVLMYDHGAHLVQVQEEIVDKWGQTHATVRERAMRNLRALQRPEWENAGNGVWRVHSEVSYEESFVLIDEVFASLPWSGDPVVAVPNRGVLLAASRQDLVALDALISQARESMLSGPWPLSGTLLTRVSGRWQRFEPPAELAAQTSALRTLSDSITYNEQQTALQKYYEQSGDDVFVASLMLYESPAEKGHGILSATTWTEGVVASLPRADMIAFVRAPPGPESESLVVEWSHVARICPHLLKNTVDDPERFRVDGFPTEEEWRQLRAASG